LPKAIERNPRKFPLSLKMPEQKPEDWIRKRPNYNFPMLHLSAAHPVQ